jgi:hypothetical protein
MTPAPGQKSHGYRLSRSAQCAPGAGGPARSVQPLSGAPLLTRVSSIFGVNEPIQRGVHQAPADIYTLAHLASGSLLGFGRAPWWAIFSVAVGWSGLGYLAQRLWPAPVAATSMQNLVGDSAAMVLGWALAKTWVESRLESSETVIAPSPEEILP